MQEQLSDENFLILSAKYYRNSQCSSTEEFIEDLKRIKYLKKIFTRYETNQNIDERLVLNHIIILNNVFGPKFLCRILFLKLKKQMKYVKPFLIYLNLLSDKIENINGQIYDSVDIEMDEGIIERLRKIPLKDK
jgi:hypothetical protein